MQIGGIQLFQALGDKMRWHQERQGVLAENIANADTPGFMERDLKAFSFGGLPAGVADSRKYRDDVDDVCVPEE